MAKLRWRNLGVGRTALLTLIGFGSLVAAGFLYSTIAGLIALGVSSLLLEAITGPSPEKEGLDG